METLSPCQRNVRRLCAFLALLLLAVGIASATDPIRRRRLGGGVQAFDARQYPGLLLWTPATSVVGVSDGAKISSWPDLSGNSRSWSQGAAGNQPTYKTGQVAGYPAIRFISAATSSMTTPTFTLTQPVTLFVVVNFPTWTSNVILQTTNDGALGVLRVQQFNSTPELDLYSGSAFGCPNTGATLGSWKLLTAVFNGASSSLQVNQGVAVTGSVGTTGTTNGLWIGSNSNAGQYVNADVAEEVIYGSLTSGQIAAIQVALIKKYRLS